MSNVIPFPLNCNQLAEGFAQTRKRELWAALRSLQELGMQGFEVEQGESNCIVVIRNGHAHGLWH